MPEMISKMLMLDMFELILNNGRNVDDSRIVIFPKNIILEDFFILLEDFIILLKYRNYFQKA